MILTGSCVRAPKQWFIYLKKGLTRPRVNCCLQTSFFSCHGKHRQILSRPLSTSYIRYCYSNKPPTSNSFESSDKSNSGQDDKSKISATSSQREHNKTTDASPAPAKLTVFQRFKQTYKEHGKVLIAVEVVTSIMWYGLFYLIVSSGLDVIGILESFELSDTIMQPFRSSNLGNLVVAFLLYKLISPVRYAVTILGTTCIIRYMRQTGRIPHMTESNKLTALYKDSKVEFQEARAKLRRRLPKKSSAKIKTNSRFSFKNRKFFKSKKNGVEKQDKK